MNRRSTNWINVAWIAFFLGVLLTSHARGEAVETFVRAGADFIHAKQESIYSLGINRFLDDNWFMRLDGGFWIDNQAGHSSALYASMMFGGRVGDLAGWHFDLALGPMFQSGSDSVLGSALQFTEDAFIGYQNISLGVKHISNAGVLMPNLGRNQVMIQYTIPLWN